MSTASGCCRKVQESDRQSAEIIGSSQAMRGVRVLMQNASKWPLPVLIEGETGTGKELIARAIHFEGCRGNGPFITQNCGALPDTLFESELFGYKPGAFTGANLNKTGLFEAADGGTLFLDEVTELPVHLQGKLLRILQSGELRRLGDTTSRTVDVRILAATNRAIDEEIRVGRFRKDLYYRLDVFHIRVPPLRERVEDIPLLAEHFMRKFSERLRKPVRGIAAGALQLLMRYSYPGNVRELESEMARAVALCEPEGLIEAGLLSERFSQPDAPPRSTNPISGRLQDTMKAFERATIGQALQRHSGNKAATARELKITYRGLLKKIQALHPDGLDAERAA